MSTQQACKAARVKTDMQEPICFSRNNIPYDPTPTRSHLFSRTSSLCRVTMSPLVSWLMTALLRMCLAR